jgi:hypothetical protein
MWFDIRSAHEFIRDQAETWLKQLRPGDVVHRTLTDIRGNVVVVYYKQTEKEVVWTILTDPYQR